MESKDLTTDQLSEVYTHLRPADLYLFRLQERMKERGFPPDDPLLVLVVKSHAALHEVCHEFHRRSISHWFPRVVSPDTPPPLDERV